MIGTVFADNDGVVLSEARPVGDQAVEARGERGRADYEGDDRRERGDRAVRGAAAIAADDREARANRGGGRRPAAQQPVRASGDGGPRVRTLP